ncbi:hypothetical protein PG911_08800 [Tenacibaculum ovolyticum]|uniref:hypothetical protein n=1 Tax=Tenacibaculum ovolyticum TaxID=104270 RepID=UPI0022F3E811|nr:hypothetical protein [Tenacibaculum ovolyticum]WBX78344.1 hypothetical protein PG911_08800 [Tenacibaculum ovolyticum]
MLKESRNKLKTVDKMARKVTADIWCYKCEKSQRVSGSRASEMICPGCGDFITLQKWEDFNKEESND